MHVKDEDCERNGASVFWMIFCFTVIKYMHKIIVMQIGTMRCDIVILGYNGAICTVRLKMLLIGVLY